MKSLAYSIFNSITSFPIKMAWFSQEGLKNKDIQGICFLFRHETWEFLENMLEFCYQC